MNQPLDILKDILAPKPIVSFREFVTSSEFCNCKDMYEFWFNSADKLPDTVSELLIDGSLGGGKSWFSNYYLAYRVYKLFAKGSPQKQLGLAEDSEIFGFYFSISLDMAKQSGFQHLYDLFTNNKWFKENAPVDANYSSKIVFPKFNFIIKAGSDFGHQLGLNVWCFILDEANFRSGVGIGVESEYVEVTQLYTQLLDRQTSRLAKPDGSIDALAILISSASYQSSFMERRKQQTKKDPNVKNITAVSYEIRPERYSKERFEVFVGSGSIEPCIIETPEQKQRIIQASGLAGTGEEENFFVYPPVSIKKQYELNIVLALQNHSGRSTLIQGSLISNLRYLHNSYTDELPMVFQSETLEASTEDDVELIEYFMPEYLQFPERPHSLFLDLSVQGDTGSLVMVRYDGRVDNKDVHTKVFELKIIPPKFPAQTEIGKVERLILNLAEYVNLVAFASDQYQSTSLRQNVNKILGLEDIRMSIDSSDIPHMHWIRGLVEGRLKQRKSEFLEKETAEAVHDHKKHRVLKAKGSTDDVLQANVGAFYLSDTFGKSNGSIEDLYGKRINLVGGKSINKVLSELGYTN